MGCETAILVVSYGTSQVSALPPLTAIVREVGEAFPGLPLMHAFTSRFLRDTLARRGGPDIPHVSDALAQLAQQGVSQVLLQPTHLLPGGEYHGMVEQLKPCTAQLTVALGDASWESLVTPTLVAAGIGYGSGTEVFEWLEENGHRVMNISFTDDSMYLPLPEAEVTNAPILREPAVEYDFD